MKEPEQEIGAPTVLVEVQTPPPKTYTVLVEVERLPLQHYEVLVEWSAASATSKS